jgi:pyridoxine 5'-phosphate synthase PdxJ
MAALTILPPMAATAEMIALRHKPHAVCIVPKNAKNARPRVGLRSRAKKTIWPISSPSA